MPVKIRLARHGRKRKPFYYIVAADSRAPRDGRYIERIGSYNPNTNPATIDLNFDKALTWLQNGAVPTDTCRAILSYNGVLYKNHLLKGITKGALTEEQAEAKFQEWMKGKEAKIQAKKDKLANDYKSEKSQKLDAEAEVSKKRAEEIAKKRVVEEAPVEEEVITDEVVAEKVDAQDDTEAEAKTDEQVDKKKEE